MLHKRLELWSENYLKEHDVAGVPVMDTYVLDGERSRSAVLVCPGGGYGMTSSREAEAIALQFNAVGYHAFVLYYSVAPNRHPQPLRDVSRAMCMIRDHAAEWNVDAERIAVCGFSAGGHLAASLGVHWGRTEWLDGAPGVEVGANRPNALILSYPVITSGEFAHQGSFNNLLGDQPDPALLAAMSLETQVTAAATPPTFVWHTVEDQAVPVENALLFAGALRSCGVPFELHIYPDGPHGLSLATAETDNGVIGSYPHVAGWMKQCIAWLDGVLAK